MDMDRYVGMALEKGAVDAMIIDVADIVFDPRTYLKCAWGCEEFGQLKCSPDLIKPWEAEPIFRRYSKALLVHTFEKKLNVDIAWEVERAAFLDGYYFAFALYDCSGCEICEASSRADCMHPEKARPGDDFCAGRERAIRGNDRAARRRRKPAECVMAGKAVRPDGGGRYRRRCAV